jgi:anti-sigma factor RsiW
MTVTGVFGLPHLSEDAVAAFADGVLSAAAADRARRHCAECTECAEAVRAQRETALLLRTASNPSMSADLLSRLATVPMSAPLPPPCGGLPTVLGADGRPMFVAHDPRNADRLAAADPNRPGPRNQPGPSHGHRRVLLPVGILASAAAVVAAGAIGSQLTSVPRPAEQQPASVYQVSSTSTGSVQRSSSPTRTRSSRSLGNLAGQTAANPTGSGLLSPALVSPRPPLIRPLGAAPTATAARSGS